jgi:hypothetical protein
MEIGTREISFSPVAAGAAYLAKLLIKILARHISTITTTTIILLKGILSTKQ